MHKKIPRVFVYLDKLDHHILDNNNKNIGIIYRNYKSKKKLKNLLKIAAFCRIRKYPLFVANDLKLALKVNAKGIYIPSFNKLTVFNNYLGKKNLIILGSAHNFKEINEKIKQKCHGIFLSPIFFSSKNRKKLDIIKFNFLTIGKRKNFYALGGIDQINLKKLQMLNIKGFAGIGIFKKKTGLFLGRLFKT